MEKARRLPIGLQEFGNVRTRDCVYVDKTEFIYELAQNAHPYFLSRPRRFGKSLLISTLEAYFLGKKELFTGLAIEKLETEWIEYPVLKISFGGNSFSNLESLKSTSNRILSHYEELYGIEKQDENFSNRFYKLMEKNF